MSIKPNKSPLELLTPDPNKKQSWLNDKYNPLLCGVLGVGVVCYYNWGTRRPVFSGIQKHIIGGALGLVIGKYFDNRRNDYLAERDAVLRHYIELHPDDFQTPERKTFNDIFQPWIPIR